MGGRGSRPPGDSFCSRFLRSTAMWQPSGSHHRGAGVLPLTARRSRRSRNLCLPRFEPLEERITLSSYWVSPSGDDSNPGTQTQPWKTLQANVATLAPGDNMNVEAGTYAGFIVGWDATG